MCLRRAPEKYIAGAALDRAGLDNRPTDGGEVVSLARRPRFTPKKIWYTFLLEAEPQGLVRLE
jgi:hypothetical protein